MKPAAAFFVLVLGCSVGCAQMDVPSQPVEGAKPLKVRDSKYGVRFEVPAGWSFYRKDRQVSTFHVDARSAGKTAEMRGVAAMNFNPFPESTLSGAWFYFSVQRHTNDGECAREAYRSGPPRDVESVGGMEFQHGHDEQKKLCVELRDDVYTAYRKGSCYRFDLVVGTFCAISSGAQEMSEQQMEDVRQRMQGVLGSVVFDWGPVGVVAPQGSRRRLP